MIIPYWMTSNLLYSIIDYMKYAHHAANGKMVHLLSRTQIYIEMICIAAKLQEIL